MATIKKKSHAQLSDNPYETVRDMGREVITELGSDSVNALWDQLMGGYSREDAKEAKSGDLAEGQEINLSPKKAQEQNSYIEAGIDYRREIIHGEQKITRENEQQLVSQIQEIIGELQRLITSSKELESQFKDVASVQAPAVKAGKYHVNFFSWVLSVVRSARIKVEDSGAWLSMFKSKKGQKQYWSMFEQHGTSFAMSNERMIATQTG